MNPRSVEIKRLRKKADTLLQEIVRMEFPACEHCGKPTRAGHHFFPKGSSAELRYDFQNMIALCNGCHVAHHMGSNPAVHAKVLRVRGEEWYGDLFSRKSITRTRNAPYYRKVIQELESRLMLVSA